MITPTASWVEVTLDTRAPKLTTVTVLDDTTEAWQVLITADEDIGGAEFLLRDSLGVESEVGYSSPDDRTLLVTVPMEGASAGPLLLRGLVWDEVGNSVVVNTQHAPRTLAAFSVLLEIGRAFDVELSVDRAYESTLTVDRAWDVTLGMRNA